MKTSPGNQAHRQTAVNFVSTDQVLVERLRLYFTQSKSLRFEYSETPLPEDGIDCYVLPYAIVSTLIKTDRRPDTWLPVIAYGSQVFLRQAFNLGCRDYLKDPWEPSELEARLEAVVKPAGRYLVGEKHEEIVIEGKRLKSGSLKIVLSLNEARIIRALLQYRGEVVPREVLYYAIWGRVKPGESRVVDVYVSSIRKKLKNKIPLKIEQVRGEGYLLS